MRAVHLAGPIAAMDLMLTGRTIRPKQALAMGLVDRLAPVEQLDKMAKQIALSPPPARSPKFTHGLLNSALVRPILAGQMRSQVARRASRPLPAPYALIELWQRYGEGRACLRGRSALDGAALVHADFAQSRARLLLQDRLKSAARKPAASPPGTCTSSVQA